MDQCVTEEHDRRESASASAQERPGSHGSAANPWKNVAIETVVPVGLNANAKATSNATNNQTNDSSNQGPAGPENPVNFVDDPREKLDERVKQCAEGEGHEWANNAGGNMVVSIAIDMILDKFKHRRTANTSGDLPMTPGFEQACRRCMELFPQGTCTFAFPTDASPVPSPKCHQIEGSSFMHLDWQLCWPHDPLPCPHCVRKERNGGQHHHDSVLVHARHNCGKKKRLFHVFDAQGATVPVAMMVCQCQRCKMSVGANDGELLNMLPAHMAQTYPVHPRHATGKSFHLHRDLSDMVDSAMKTRGNASFVSRQMIQQQGRCCIKRLHSCLSKNSKENFPDFESFGDNQHPPSDQAIRKLHFQAECCSGLPHGCSHMERHFRELESVAAEEGDVITFDHTFQVLKNHRLPLGKACFAGMKGSTKEIIALATVPSASMKHASHALRKSVNFRRIFKPKIVCTDTCPNGTQLFKELFGDEVDCKLGLFHFSQRVADTLDPKCRLCWKCLRKFQSSICFCNVDDCENLEKALKEGLINPDEGTMTTKDIEKIHHGSVWKRKHDKHLRKSFWSVQEIKSNLEAWIREHEGETDTQGRPVFNTVTAKVTRKQMENIQHVLDGEGLLAHREAKAPEGATHNLSACTSNRPESHLEKFHEFLAHFANSSMTPENADAPCARGTAECNLLRRWRLHVDEHASDPKTSNNPKCLMKAPPFMDHACLDPLNRQASAKNVTIPFPNATKPVEVSAESHLSACLKEEVARNNISATEDDNATCQCRECCGCVDVAAEDVVNAADEQQQENRNESEHQITQETTNVQNDPPRITENEPMPLRFPAAPPHMHPRMPRTPVVRGHPDGEATRCFPYPPFRCPAYQQCWNKKQDGESVRGRPPHSHWCFKASPAGNR